MERASPEGFSAENSLVPACGHCSADLSNSPDLGASPFEVLGFTSLQRQTSCADWGFDEGCPKSCLLRRGLHGGPFHGFIGKVVPFSSCTNFQHMTALVCVPLIWGCDRHLSKLQCVTSPHYTSGGASSSNSVRGRSGSTVGPSGSHDIIGQPQKASGPTKKQKAALSQFWDTHHTNENVKRTPYSPLWRKHNLGHRSTKLQSVHKLRRCKPVTPRTSKRLAPRSGLSERSTEQGPRAGTKELSAKNTSEEAFPWRPVENFLAPHPACHRAAGMRGNNYHVMVSTTNMQESSYSSGLWDDIIATWLPYTHVAGRSIRWSTAACLPPPPPRPHPLRSHRRPHSTHSRPHQRHRRHGWRPPASSAFAGIAQLAPSEPTRHPSSSDVRFGGPLCIQMGRMGSPPKAHQTADPMQLLTRPYLAESLLRNSLCKALAVRRTTCEGNDHMAGELGRNVLELPANCHLAMRLWHGRPLLLLLAPGKPWRWPHDHSGGAT